VKENVPRGSEDDLKTRRLVTRTYNRRSHVQAMSSPEQEAN
jgi:hypothetical protein